MQCFSSSPLDSRAAHIGESLPALWDKAFGEPEDWDRYSCEDEMSISISNFKQMLCFKNDEGNCLIHYMPASSKFIS